MARPVACRQEPYCPLREEPRDVTHNLRGATSRHQNLRPTQGHVRNDGGGDGSNESNMDAMGGSDLPSPTRGLRPSLRRSRCSNSNPTTSRVDTRAMSSTMGHSGSSCPIRNTKVSRARLLRWLHPMCRTSM